MMLLRDPKYTVQYLMQWQRAAVEGAKYEAYALQIGCQVQNDVIICDEHQAKLLAAEWKRLTETMR